MISKGKMNIEVAHERVNVIVPVRCHFESGSEL